VLVHAAAGYGKTTALAATQERGWLWYNLDRADRSPLTLATRLSAILGIDGPSPDLSPYGEAVATELADRLDGRALTVTFDRFEHIGDAPEIGHLLSELMMLLPALSLRVATRTRPVLPLERLRLEGRMVEAGPAEMRLDRSEIANVMTDAWGRPPRLDELDFADTVLCGWPAAIQLWLAGTSEGMELTDPLQPGQPLHDYLSEEVLAGTLNPETLDPARIDLSWLLGPGPLIERASTGERRTVMAQLVRDRVGVIPGQGGWHIHPLVSSFLAVHAAPEPELEPPPPELPAVVPARSIPSQVVIRTLGGLAVAVGQVQVEENAWPTAARRLLELLLCLPGHQTTAQQAARALWPRHLPRSAINSFNVALHGLRRLLEPELTAGAESRYVVRQGRTYRLCLDRLMCDAEEFSQLIRAVALPLTEPGARQLEDAVDVYRGDFLAESGEEFVQDKRARLRRVMLESLERLGEWHSEAGRSEEALRVYNRLLELGPHREDIWARVLELYLADGDQYRALAALQQCEQSLLAAGIEPSGLLKELHRRIRREAPIPLTWSYGTP
jgi:DNA-binding SARP family transcriptional activator